MERFFDRKYAIPMVGAFLLGCLFSLAVVSVYVLLQENGRDDGTILRDLDSSYTYVKPLLACNVGASEETPALSLLRSHFQHVIDDALSAGEVEQVSVFFRELDSGDWTAIDHDVAYTPASLLKLPIFLVYLKRAEEYPSLLDEQVVITEDPAPNAVQFIPPAESVEVGKTYSVRELLRLMIVHSDNRALNVLTEHLDRSVLQEMLEDLGLPVPGDTAYTLTPRMYSRFFRILYNGTYLTDAQSEDALALLAGVSYKDGLAAGVPENVSIAHKFGEASAKMATGESGHELHDCGIVYAEKPYVICVMTRGKNDADLARVIARLSAEAYEFVAINE